MSQSDDLLVLLRRNGDRGVTALDALNEIGCMRLAARVWDLNKEGHVIVADSLTTGRGKRVARYVLVDFEPPVEGQLDAGLA